MPARACRCVRNDMRKTALDKLVSSLGFLYDVNYDQTVAIIGEQGYYRLRIEELADINAGAHKRLKRLLTEASTWISERCEHEKAIASPTHNVEKPKPSHGRHVTIGDH